MLDLPFRQLPGPLPGWAPANANRLNSQFTASHTDTLNLLARELDALGAQDWHAGVVCNRPDAFRLDGGLRANAKVDHPGVSLTIVTGRYGTLVYETDVFAGRNVYRGGTYHRVEGWQANLRAIALGLEALRKVERYGIGRRGEQYAGYRELGAGTPLPPAAMTFEQAAEFIAVHAWGPNVDPQEAIDNLDDAYRAAAKKLHPDTDPEDPELFKKLTDAKRIVESS